MSWQCRLIECNQETSSKTLKIGDMFYAPTLEEVHASKLLDPGHRSSLWWFYAMSKPTRLSDFYKQHNSHRRPVLIWLPNRILFCIDSGRTSAGIYSREGWTVSGTPPLITITPSLNLEHQYHGNITNGVMTDDCEGRRYDEEGRLIR